MLVKSIQGQTKLSLNGINIPLFAMNISASVNIIPIIIPIKRNLNSIIPSWAFLFLNID